MKKTPLVHWIAALAVVLVSTQLARAQTTWTGATNGTNNWLTGANWSGGAAPNATNTTVVFTNTANVAWTNATNTIGTLRVTGGTVVLGNPTNSISNALVLATSTGKPVISNTSTIFMYADLQGTNGFTKLGSGELSFRFNGRNLTYTGDIDLLGGQLSVNQASSLGNVNNRLLVGSNAVFSVANGANSGNYNFEATRTFVVSNGVTFSIRTSTNAITAVFSNSIVESGTPGASIVFQNVGALGTNESSANRYTLAGTSNNWSGTTTLQMGTKLTLAPGAVISTNVLANAAGSTNIAAWAGLDLGGNTQSVGQFTYGGASTVARTFVISNGVLRVTNPTSLFSFQGANGTLLDLSNSSGFVFSGASSGASGRNFVVRADMSSGLNVTNTMVLATAGSGSNTITAADIIIGTASGTTGGTNHLGRLVVGKTNNFYANQLLIGGGNGAGSVQAADGLANPYLILRGSNGVSAMNNLIIGDTSSGIRPGSGSLALSNGTIDAVVTSMIIGRHIAGANNSETSSFSMGGGTLTAGSLQMSVKSSTGTPTMTDTFTQNGGTVTISNITMGSDAGGGATARLLPTYNLFGGTLYTTNFAAGAGSFAANSARTLQFSNGGVLQNISGANLLVDGTNATAAGRLSIVMAGNGSVGADSGQSVTFGANTLVSGAGVVTKTGNGTLVLQAANTHSGGTTLSAGAIEAAADSALGSGTIGLNGGTLLAFGAARSYTNAVSVGGNVTLGGSGNGLTFSGPVNLGGASRTLTISDNTTISGAITNGGLSKAGASTLTLSGANSYSGGTVVSAGTLVGSSTSLQGAITNDAAIIFDQSATGTFGGSITGTGTLAKQNSGTLTLSANNDFSGATTISAGRLTVNGTNANSAVTVSSGASLGGNGEVAALTVGGTLAPGNSVGTLSAGNTTFLGGGSFELEMWNWSTTAGTGWDLLDITGDLTLSNTTGNKFTITLVSMSSATTIGLSTNFSSSSSFTNAFVNYTGSLLGSSFSADLFNVNTAGFQNPFSGTFAITNIGQTLALVYTAPAAVSSYDWNVGSGDWATTGNWTNGAAPTNGAAISFSGAGGLSTNNEVSSISGMTFSGTSGSYTVSGDALDIGTAGIVNESANSHSVENNISLAGNATFGATSNSLVISGNVTNSSGLLTVAGPNNVDISGVLSGAGSLNKTAGGTLTLSASNSYSGGSTLISGTIAAGDDSALGSGSVTLSGGTLAASGGARSLANAVTINGNTTLGGLGSSLTLGGAVDLAGAMRIITTADNATLSGIVSNGGLTKDGAATLTLSGANTYSGGTFVSAGALAGDTTGLQGPITNNAAVIFDQATDGTFAGLMSGSGFLEKTGAGTLTLTGANSYTGGTLVTLGTLAGSTASLQGPITNNSSVVFSQTTNGTYSGAMIGSGSLTKSGTGTVTLSGANGYNGGTLVSAGGLIGSTTSLQGPITNNATVVFDQSTDGTYSGAMSGTGALTKSGNGTVTLSGANNYSGATTINAGRIALSGSGAISTGNLVFAGTTPGSLSLGGNSQTVANISSTFTSAGTVTITGGGSLTINGDANQVFGNALNGSVWDVSGLNSFTFNRTNREFLVRPTTTGASVTNTFNMAVTGDGLNIINASRVVFGAAAGSSTGSNHLTLVNLGKTNTINTDSLEIGGFNGAGSVAFSGSVTNASPILTLRAADGTSRLAAATVGWTTAGVNERQGNGTLNLSGGSVDGFVGTLTIGRHGANAASLVTGSVTMQAGTMDVTTLVLSEKTATTGTPTVNGTFNQSGGTVTAATMYLGNNQGTALANFVANYNLTGGTLFAQTITGNGADYGSSTVRNLNVNGGTVRNITGNDLSINGLANTASGRVNVVLGASGGMFEADSGRNITVGANSLISSTGRLNKTGDGTLTIASANTYSGGTTVGGGSVVANNNTAFGTGTVTLTNGTALAGAGQTIANNFALGSSALTTNSFTSTNVAGWDFNGLASGGADGLAPTTSANSGISIIGLTRGFGASNNAATAGNAWGANWFTNTTSVGAATEGQFAYFSITVSNGFALNLTNLDAYNVRRSSSGPTTGLWQYSLDGTNFADIGSAVTWGAVTTSAGNSQSAISLDGIGGLQGISGGSTVTFRVLNYGGTSTNGTWYLNNFQAGNDFGLNGAIATVTEGVASGSGTVGIQEAGTAVFSGNFAVNNAGTLTAAAGGQSSFTGVFTGGASTSLAKSGSGTVTLSGNNSYAGSLSVNEGILELATSGGSAAGSVASVSVASGATLLLSQSAQVNNTATVSLSGGTISRASGVSETFGALSVSSSSALDFGSGTSGNMTFGVYEGDSTPSALLTVNNFFGGNTLVFGSDLSAYIDASYNGTSFTSTYFNINSISGGFTSSWNAGTSTFTITAIPEPSTYLAAAGLLGLMLWPSRRRLLKDAKSILGLRAPMRDRLMRH